MSKPIFIVRFPMETTLEAIEDARRILNNHPLSQEYHLLIIRDQYNDDEIMFECFNSPHTEMEFEELKRRVLELLK